MSTDVVTGRSSKYVWRARTLVALRYLALVAVFILTVGPFLWQLSTSLKGVGEDLYQIPPRLLPENPTFENYHKVAEAVPVWRYAGNSLVAALMNVTFNVVGASAAGYALARLRFRGRNIAFGIFIITLLAPAESLLISQFLVMKSIGLNDTLLGVVLPGAVGALNVLLMYNAFRRIPKEIDEAAVLDGANVWQRFRFIGLPSVWGTVAVVAIFAFVGTWDDFLWPLIVLSSQEHYTLTVGLNYLQGVFATSPSVVAAGAIIAVAPLIVLFFALQRYFFMGLSEGGVKG